MRDWRLSYLEVSWTKIVPMFLLILSLCAPRVGAETMGGSRSFDAIAPGDMLSIRVFGDEGLTAVWHGTSVGYTVDSLGNLNFPLLGEVRAAGHSIDDLQKYLETSLSQYLVYPKVNISFYKKEIGQKVSILGQVAKPGSYDHRQGMTITQLISEAGDFTRVATPLSGMRYIADTERVQVIRKNVDKERTFEVNVGEIMAGRAQDFEIEPSDLVVVLQGNMSTTVSILGQVMKPGNYELESGMTLLRLISGAQGFSRYAESRRVVINRGSGTSRTVNVEAILMGRENDAELNAGDVIFVPESTF